VNKCAAGAVQDEEAGRVAFGGRVLRDEFERQVVVKSGCLHAQQRSREGEEWVGGEEQD